MSIWWLIPAFVGLVGVLMLVGGIMAVFKAKLGSGLLRVLFGGLTLAGAMIVGLIGLNLQTYAALSKERLAGQVVLKKAGDHVYTASLDLADDGKLRGKPVDFQITGERVHISGPVVKFKPWANVIGMDSLFKVSEIYGTYVDPNCTNTYTPRRETTEECNSGDFFGCLGTSWKLLNLADLSHTSDSGQLMADGAVYDIYASQDAFELKPNLDNTIALDLQSQQVPGGAQNCTAVTTPVQTPEGAVQYNAPAASPALAAPKAATVAPRVTPPAQVVVPQTAPATQAPTPAEPVPAPTAPVEPATPPATPPG